MSQILKKANDYIEARKLKVRDPYYPNFHFTPICGWINDPNGFVFYNNEYHLFYQYHPYDTIWGPMHWGHAVSKDLIKWTHLPVAIAPDMPYDKDGCFSGSSIEKDGSLFLIYTGHVHPEGDKNHYIQEQCVAVSRDGINFEKVVNNPVIPSVLVPEKASKKDFRDPRVFRKNNKYYTIVGSKTENNFGQILLYESEDLIKWNFKSVMLKGNEQFGTMWECPEMFQLNGKDILVISPIAMAPQGDRFTNVSSAIWMIGQFNPDDGSYLMKEYGEIDHGFDFYAPQTTISPDGKRIMSAWMEIWEHRMPAHEMKLGWTGSMIIPRELTVEKNTLIQRPASSLTQYCTMFEEVRDVSSDSFEKTVISEKSLRIKAKIEVKEETIINLQVYTKESENVLLTYNNMEFTMFREGSPYLEPATRRTDVFNSNGYLELDLILDGSALEVYLDGGRRVMSARVYPKNTKPSVQLSIEGKFKILELKCFSIEIE